MNLPQLVVIYINRRRRRLECQKQGAETESSDAHLSQLKVALSSVFRDQTGGNKPLRHQTITHTVMTVCSADLFALPHWLPSPWLHILVFCQSEKRHKMPNEQLGCIVEPSTASWFTNWAKQHRWGFARGTIRKQGRKCKEVLSVTCSNMRRGATNGERHRCVRSRVSDPQSRFCSPNASLSVIKHSLRLFLWE